MLMTLSAAADNTQELALTAAIKQISTHDKSAKRLIGNDLLGNSSTACQTRYVTSGCGETE